LRPVRPRTIVSIETSCDETAVAILKGRHILSSEVASQIDIHKAYGGVVPEVASRNHLRALRPTLDRALEKAGVRLADVEAVAATYGPGLATSLMIGSSIAKGLAIAEGLPFHAINHLEGHLLSPFFGNDVRPAIGLVVSGGHTLLVQINAFSSYKLLGQTVDDAAGEAFDKVGKLLGLPYPGGPHVNRFAAEGDPKRYHFPRSMMDSNDFMFSFSGLKTAVRYMLPKLGEYRVEDICASFQEAVVDVLVGKTLRAVEHTGISLVALSGGVSSNTRLRARFAQECAARNIEFLVAEPQLCTDNAAMIGFVAALRVEKGQLSPLTIDINPNLGLA
jgi:tRNA N6-adenosine threonylcarbamoyltransferase